MRQILSGRNGQSDTYTATYICSSVGSNANHGIVHTILLQDVKTASGKSIGGDGHIWVTTPYPVYGLHRGDRIEITAVIEKYRRGDGSVDFSLGDIKSVRKLPEVAICTQ